MSYLRVIKRLPLILVLIFVSLSANAQFTDNSVGLLNAPSGDFNESGTFMITNTFLNSNMTPPRWNYNTFGYGFDITFFSRVEIFYSCVIFNYKWAKNGQERAYQINQDRHFGARFLILKENEFGKSWIPSLVVGCSDPTATDIEVLDYTSYSGHFNKYYVASAKTFNTDIGTLKGHVGYVFNLLKDSEGNYHLNGVTLGITYSPIWLQNRWFDPKFVFEYDARTPNIGFIADIWDDRFEAMFCLQNFQWVSFGLRFKLRLKGSE